MTIGAAIAIVLAIKTWVVNPYKIPSASMEPTLHCARPGVGCESRFSDRVLANRFIYRFRDPHRGEIVVFNTPPAAKQECGEGGVFVKRLIGLPGELVHEDEKGFIWINHKKLDEPYIKPKRRDARHRQPGGDLARAVRAVLLHGRQPRRLVRLAALGLGAAQEPDRPGLRHLLASEPNHAPLAFRVGPPGLFL